jgi:heat shock protein HtpX
MQVKKNLSLLKLRLSMLGTLALIIGASTAFFALILGIFGSLNIILLVTLVASFNIIQWLFAPHLINALYKVKEVKYEDSPRLYSIVEQLSTKSDIKLPKIGISNISIPNAFAYSSPIAGSHVAVTRGLLDTLDEEEIEAVLGHELGHLKHKDVQIMMVASFLPSLCYIIARSALLSSFFGGRREKGSSAAAILVGVIGMLAYWVLTMFSLGLSRLREYYADSHSATIVEDGARKLSEGLAKIVSQTANMKKRRQREAVSFNSFKALFISDPDRAESDVAQIAYFSSDQELVQKLLTKKLTTIDRFMELFSTHPNIVKRLKALQSLRS